MVSHHKWQIDIMVQGAYDDLVSIGHWNSGAWIGRRYHQRGSTNSGKVTDAGISSVNLAICLSMSPIHGLPVRPGLCPQAGPRKTD